MHQKARCLVLIVYLHVAANLPRTCECRAKSSSAVQTSAVSQVAPSHLSMPTVITDSIPNTKATIKATAKPGALDALKAFITNTMSSSGSLIARKLLRSGISSECSIGILKFMRALENLEPWALRMIDATGKFPTGLFQANTVEAGAYDECIETVFQGENGMERVRAQYCSIYLQLTGSPSPVEEMMSVFEISHKRSSNFSKYFTDGQWPGVRLGVCFITDCTEEDLQKVANTFLEGVSTVVVRNCVTNRTEPASITQICVIAVLGTISATIILSTAFDYSSTKCKKWKPGGYLHNFLTAFSLIKNTRYLFKANINKSSDTYAYGFVHGLRIISIFWIILGHKYGETVGNGSRVVNVLHIFENWHSVIVTFGFQAVDTFFFFSGFFTFFKLEKENGNPFVVSVVAVVRRFIRVTIPTFFMIMCMYILPLIASGPNSKEYYTRFYAEVRDTWWDLLLLVRNWKEDAVMPIFPHLWYLSTDFQLFLVSLVIIQAFKAKKALAISLFGMLSFVSCAIATWQVYGSRLPPFMIGLTQLISLFMDQYNKYYKLPFYHGVCFFSGCITFVIVQKYSHKRLPGIFQAVCWCVALFCGLFCLFVKHEWYAHDGRAPEPTRMFYAFADRIFFSVFLSWFVFACATRRAGVFGNRWDEGGPPVARFAGVQAIAIGLLELLFQLWDRRTAYCFVYSHFKCNFTTERQHSFFVEPLRQILSWQGLLPLSRLSFGVYLLHFPILSLTLHIARERTFYSHYTLVSESFAVLIWSCVLSYLMFVMCEGPTANLEMLLFLGHKARLNEGKSVESTNGQVEPKELQPSSNIGMAFAATEGCSVAEKICRL